MSAVSGWPFRAEGGLEAEHAAAWDCAERLTFVDFVHKRLPPTGKALAPALVDLGNELAIRIGLVYPVGGRAEQLAREPQLRAARARVDAAMRASFDFETIMSIEVA